MYFFDVQMSVADQFAAKEQNGNLVAVAHPRGGIRVNVDDV